MFALLNVAYLAGMAVLSTVLYAEQDYPYPVAKEEVTVVSAFREWWREDGRGKCKYEGILVPYTRTWELVINPEQGAPAQVLPPEPDKVAGNVLIMNRKVCGDKVTPQFQVSEFVYGWRGAATSKQINKYAQFMVVPVADMKAEDRPKWLAQILQRVERVSATNKVAKDFVEFNKKATFEKMPEDLVKLIKNHGTGTPTATPTAAAKS